jgi:acyl carrier protein
LWLVGRRAPSDAASARIARLREQGVTVEVRSADVADRAAIAAVVSEIAALRGVVHAAGVIDDGMLHEQTRARWREVLRPKALGAFHLHELTRDRPLDFFVCFSSASALLRSITQSSYSAANGFMDGLMQARNAGGLRGLSVAWGTWSGVGMLSRLSSAARTRSRVQGLEPIPPRKALRALEQWIAQPTAYVMLAGINWPALARRVAPRPIPLYLEALAGPDALGAAAGGAGAHHELLAAGALRAELDAAPASERVTILVTQLRALLAQVLGFTSLTQIDPHSGLFDLGIDSLSALETKTRLEVALSAKLAASAMMDHATPEALALHIHDDVLGYSNQTTGSYSEEVG